MIYPIIFCTLWFLIIVLYLRYIWNLPYSNYSFSLLYTIGAFGVFFISFFPIIPLLKWVYPPFNEIHGLAVFTIILLTYVLFTFKAIGPLFNKPIRSFLVGMTGYFFIFPFIFILSQGLEWVLEKGFGIFPTEQDAVSILKSQKDSYWLIAFITLIIPVLEEVLFRGYLQHGLKSVFSRKISIFVTALIFAFFHFSFNQGWTNLVLIASLFTLAIFMSYLVEKTGSIFSSIGLHVSFNFVSALFIIKGWE